MKAKIAIVIFFAAIACLSCKAQLKIFGIGPYAEIGSPTGEFRQTNKSGIGAGLGIDIRLSRIALIGSAGFMHFGAKQVNTSEGLHEASAINAVPIRAGFKFYYARLFYLKLESGMANYLNGNNSALILSPGIGIRLLGLDLQAKYESWIKNGSNSFWGIRAAYSF